MDADKLKRTGFVIDYSDLEMIEELVSYEDIGRMVIGLRDYNQSLGKENPVDMQIFDKDTNRAAYQSFEKMKLHARKKASKYLEACEAKVNKRYKQGHYYEDEPPNLADMEAYPSISEHIQAYPSISEHIQAYPSISEHIRAYPSISEHIRAYPSISEHIRAYPSISEHIQAYGADIDIDIDIDKNSMYVNNIGGMGGKEEEASPTHTQSLYVYSQYLESLNLPPVRAINKKDHGKVIAFLNLMEAAISQNSNRFENSILIEFIEDMLSETDINKKKRGELRKFYRLTSNKSERGSRKGTRLDRILKELNFYKRKFVSDTHEDNTDY